MGSVAYFDKHSVRIKVCKIAYKKDAVDTHTFRVKPNTPKLLSMLGKNGSQLWDLPSISMVDSERERIQQT